MGQTIAEKIISRHAGQTVMAGDLAIVPVDGAMATDATAPLAIRAFRRMGGKKLWDPKKFALILDHATPAPNERVANLHRLMREFSQEMGCHLYEVGEGICHQLMVDDGWVQPGDIFTGADSHTPTYGALGALAVGMGSTDVAGVMLTGQTWLKVPRTVKIVLDNEPQPFVSAKDIILHLVGRLGVAGATYEAVEFTGSTIPNLSLASRMTLANMVAEMGAKTALVDQTGLILPNDFEPITSDEDAAYRSVHECDVSTLEPQISLPHSPDHVRNLGEVAGQKIDQAFIGSCTNARLEDLQAAAAVVAGHKIAPGRRLIIAPASKRIMQDALADGTLETLMSAGATFITSGCGPCVGTHQGVPGDNEVVISSTNRNFRGRMGNPNANVYLASPAVVAAAAVAGEIIHPREIVA